MTASSGWDGILQPGEEILWQGQPVPGIRWRDAIGLQGVFGVIFAGFALFWMIAAATIAGAGAPAFFQVFFPLFGLPFLAVGLYLAFGHVILDGYLRSTTWYTLTDRTAFVATSAFGRRTLRSYPIREMPFLEIEDGPPGSVLFGEITLTDRANRMPRRTGFHNIADARRVFGMIRAARGALNSVDPQGKDTS